MDEKTIAQRIINSASNASMLHVKNMVTIGRGDRVIGQKQQGGDTGVLPAGRYQVVQMGRGVVWLQPRWITQDRTIWGVKHTDRGLNKAAQPQIDLRKVKDDVMQDVYDILNPIIPRFNKIFQKAEQAGMSNQEVGRAITQAGQDWFDELAG